MTEPPGPIPPGGRARRARRPLRAAVVVMALVVVGAVVFDVGMTGARNRSQAAVVATGARVSQSQATGAGVDGRVGQTARLDTARRQATARVEASLATARSQLSSISTTRYFQSLNLAAVHQCLDGVTGATSALGRGDLPSAVQTLTAASPACLSLDTGTNPVYPYDFADPFVLTAGRQYYAFGTNAAAGNIQILDSSDLVHWTTVGDALPHQPGWAKGGFTWSPAVLQLGTTFLLYYATVQASSNDECISVATASQPEGPYTDASTAPLVCQTDLGGSIDPSPYIGAGGKVFLVWKSEGTAAQGPALWSQQLGPTGTTLGAGPPSQLLTADEGWQAGVVEAPDLVSAGGQLLLFYSGNEWNTPSYGIGYATCAAPLGPCTDQSTKPLVGSGTGFSGPGGPAVFADGTGRAWLAFAAWLPGAVGFPNSRLLFLRTLDVNGGVPTVGS